MKQAKIRRGRQLAGRLKAVRKILFRNDPYLLVPIKPKEMVSARPADYCLGPLDDLLRRHDADYAALLGRLGRHFPDAEKAFGTAITNPYFSNGDALSAFAMVRHLEPRRIVEIGSGFSTLIMRAAGGDGVDIHCIDPAPRTDIDAAANRIERRSVTSCDPSLFDKLEPGDVLFLDGSHYCFNGTDVTFVFLEVLPRLKAGIIVHIHDICLPYEYIDAFTARNYNEQYILAALLTGGANWAPLLPVYYCSKKGLMPDGFSFWMKRVA